MPGKRVETKEDVLAFVQQNRAQSISFGVKRMGLFGSFLRGEQNRGSDIDVLVEFLPEK